MIVRSAFIAGQLSTLQTQRSQRPTPSPAISEFVLPTFSQAIMRIAALKELGQHVMIWSYVWTLWEVFVAGGPGYRRTSGEEVKK